MQTSDRDSSNRDGLVAAAAALATAQPPTLEQIRRVCSLRFTIGEPDHEVFLPLRGIESETDDFPTGALRARCSEDYLRRKDLELNEYLRENLANIREYCVAIIAVFEGKK
jgi:hypothetical protein